MTPLMLRCLLGALLVLEAASWAHSAELRLQSYYGRLEIVLDESAGTVSVDVDPGARLLPEPNVDIVGDVVLIRGGRERRGTVCEDRGGERFIQTEGVQQARSLAEFPSIRVRAPRDLRLNVDRGLVFGSAGDLGAARLTLVACSDFEIGAVSGRLQGNLDGASRLSAASAGSAQIDLSGNSQVDIGVVDAGLRARVSGSGVLQSGLVEGAATLGIRDAGRVVIEGGNLRDLAITTAGTGAVVFGGHADRAALTIGGSGNVTLGSVGAPPRLTRRGTGQLSLDRVQQDP